MIEWILGLLGASVLARGGWLAFRSEPKASSWLAAAAVIVLGLSTRFPTNPNLTMGLVMAGAAAVLGAGVTLVRDQALQRDRRISLDVADDAVVRGLLRDIHEDLDRGQIGEGDAP